MKRADDYHCLHHSALFSPRKIDSIGLQGMYLASWEGRTEMRRVLYIQQERRGKLAHFPLQTPNTDSFGYYVHGNSVILGISFPRIGKDCSGKTPILLIILTEQSGFSFFLLHFSYTSFSYISSLAKRPRSNTVFSFSVLHYIFACLSSENIK